MNETDLLATVSEIRDLLQLIAEPQIAARDQKLREALREIVGRSEPKQEAVFLMDGTRSQAIILKETGVNQGHLSTMVKRLGDAKLLSGDTKLPQLGISIPRNFFAEG